MIVNAARERAGAPDADAPGSFMTRVTAGAGRFAGCAVFFTICEIVVVDNRAPIALEIRAR
jgi:hypothetical protein